MSTSLSTPADFEAEVRAAVRDILLDWVAGDPEAIERFLAWVPADFTGHGTGPGDYYADLQDLRAMVVREHEGMSHPFALDIPRMAVRTVGADGAVAEGVLEITIDIGGETVVEVPRFTFVFERLAGRLRLVHFHFSVPDAMQGHQGTMDDLIDERTRQLEAEVERRTASLNQALADLKAAQAQLVHQEKLASLGALTAGIAHEIKNPLNFVTNFAGLAREGVDDLRQALADGDTEEVDDILSDLALGTQKIEAHGKRADGIVRSMMEHARTGSAERRPVDLNALVREYAGHASHADRVRHPGLGVRLDLRLGADVGEAEVVVSEIGRVVVNLVDNALAAVRQRAAAGPEGYVPAVAVSTRRLGDAVEIRVEDNGVGIPEANRARLFEPFFTTKPTGKGTGLGLSLSHDIVVQGHGGTLGVERPEAGGAAFVVMLPVRRPAVEAKA